MPNTVKYCKHELWCNAGNMCLWEWSIISQKGQNCKNGIVIWLSRQNVHNFLNLADLMSVESQQNL